MFAYSLSIIRRDRYHRAVTARGDERLHLIETHLPIARRVARRYAWRRDQQDELAQVGALALVRAVDRCDPARDELGAYLSRCVDGEIRHFLRDRAAVVRVPRLVAPGQVAIVELDEESAVADVPLDEELLDRAAIASAARHLDERERRIVLLLYFCDYTQAEAARRLGLSQAHVSRLLDRAITKMRRHLQGGAAGV